MAHMNYIADLLNIKDKHVQLQDDIMEEMHKGVRCKVLLGQLSYSLPTCPHCGVANHSTQDMIKYGFDHTTIHLTHINFQPVLLKLKKQRYQCKHCRVVTTVPTSIVDKGCFISNDIKRTIIMELTEVQSMKLIAQHLNVSRYTVQCQLIKAGQTLSPKTWDLPEHLGIDEFKSVKQATSGMSCILMDAYNHTLLDIVLDRTQDALRDYFMRYSYEARMQVKTVTMDMYGPYYLFLQRIFPNAEIVIDRFHIVQLLNNTLNRYRIKVMNTIRYNRPRDYTKLKQLWKLIQKNRESLDFEDYHIHRLFDGLVTQKSMVNYMLSIDPRLDQVYHLVNDLKADIAMHHSQAFIYDLYETRKYVVPRKVRTTFQTLEKYLPAIENSLTYTLSNGIIEGTNNKIKNIKRSGYGYRNFNHLRFRILITQNLLVRQTKKRRPLFFKDENTTQTIVA